MNSESPFAQSLEEEDAGLPEPFGSGKSGWLFGQSSSEAVSTPDFRVVQPPRYSVGSRCRTVPTPHTEWGTVIGHIYAPVLESSGEVRQWSWIYLLLLEPDSPSRDWVLGDWVEEEDLEIFPAEQTPSTSETDSEAP